MVMRRRRAWADTRFTAQAIANAATVKSDLLVGLSSTETKTVTRILGDLHFSADALAEVEYQQVVDVGIGVVSKEAFDLETLPDMDAVADYPQNGWVYIATQLCYQSLPTGGTPTAMWRGDARFVFDIRAQRKVDRGVLFLSLLNVGVGSSTGMEVTGRVRALCLT